MLISSRNIQKKYLNRKLSVASLRAEKYLLPTVTQLKKPTKKLWLDWRKNYSKIFVNYIVAGAHQFQ